MPLTDGSCGAMRSANSIREIARRRGPRPRAWYESCIKSALRNYARPRALAQNPLVDTNAVRELAATRFSHTWNPAVSALRSALAATVDSVIASADEVDRRWLEAVLRGAMAGRTIAAIAGDLGYSREWLHRTWWPLAVSAATEAFLAMAREGGFANDAAPTSLPAITPLPRAS